MYKILIMLSILVNTSAVLASNVYVNGQEMRTVNPNHDEMMYRAAECGAYHIHNDGMVDKSKMKKILKVLRDYGVTKKEFNAVVIANIEYLDKISTGEIKDTYGSIKTQTVKEALYDWKRSCTSLELYQNLAN